MWVRSAWLLGFVHMMLYQAVTRRASHPDNARAPPPLVGPPPVACSLLDFLACGLLRVADGQLSLPFKLEHSPLGDSETAGRESRASYRLSWSRSPGPPAPALPQSTANPVCPGVGSCVFSSADPGLAGDFLVSAPARGPNEGSPPSSRVPGPGSHPPRTAPS